MKELKRLLTPRKLIAILFSIVGAYLWAAGQSDLKDAFLMIMAFYFGKSTALDKPGEDS